jgi:hypothetical protein
MDSCQATNEELAAEGYRFYAQEASEFAEASAKAVAEVVEHDIATCKVQLRASADEDGVSAVSEGTA